MNLLSKYWLCVSWVLIFSVAGVSAAQASVIDDPNNVQWVSFRDLSSSAFSSHFTKLKNKGYRIVDADAVGGRYSSVWHKSDGRGWYKYRDMKSSTYHKRWTNLKNRGYRPIDVDAYYKGNALRYSGIWIKNTENYKWASFRNLTDAQFKDRFKEYRKKGYMPIDVEGYVVGGKLRYAIIWVENRDKLQWAERRNMSASSYKKKWTEYKAKGFRPIDFESYKKGKTQYYAAIWVKNTNRRRWASYRDMTKLGYANRWRTLRDKGYRLIDFERYNTSKGYRYAGIWRQNGNRINWKYRVAVDNKVKEYKDKNKTPGISVAVAKGGKIVYRRGFGYSDVKRKRVAHSETVYYTASVGKSIGATLAMRMKEKLGFDIKKKTRSFIPAMPSHHTHTVEQLLSHRACVLNKPSPEPKNQYNSAMSAAKTIWKSPLLSSCTPKIGTGSTYKYSNSAFTLLGAVLETRGKKNIVQLLQYYLAKPLGLESLRAEYPLTANYDRSERYVGKKKIEKWSRENSSWKVLAGGMEMHVVDLARLGIKLKKGQVMSKATRTVMWTAPDKTQNYGLGWVIRKNFVTHTGLFKGARSLIRIYKNKDLVIAILSNYQYDDELSVWKLADNIVKAVK